MLAFLRNAKMTVGQLLHDVAAYLLRSTLDQALLILNQAVPEWCDRLEGVCDETPELLRAAQTNAGEWLAAEIVQPFAAAQLAEQLMRAKHTLFGTNSDWKEQIKRRKKLLKSGTEIFQKPGKPERDAGANYWLDLPLLPPLIRGIPITKLDWSTPTRHTRSPLPPSPPALPRPPLLPRDFSSRPAPSAHGSRVARRDSTRGSARISPILPQTTGPPRADRPLRHFRHHRPSCPLAARLQRFRPPPPRRPMAG